MIHHIRDKTPPKTRPFLALCATTAFYRYGFPPKRGVPAWKEVFYIDGKYSVYCGFDRIWSTYSTEFTYWMESPTKPTT